MSVNLIERLQGGLTLIRRFLHLLHAAFDFLCARRCLGRSGTKSLGTSYSSELELEAEPRTKTLVKLSRRGLARKSIFFKMLYLGCLWVVENLWHTLIIWLTDLSLTAVAI